MAYRLLNYFLISVIDSPGMVIFIALFCFLFAKARQCTHFRDSFDHVSKVEDIFMAVVFHLEPLKGRQLLNLIRDVIVNGTAVDKGWICTIIYVHHDLKLCREHILHAQCHYYDNHEDYELLCILVNSVQAFV